MYPKANDIRVAKRALIISFNGKGIEDLQPRQAVQRSQNNGEVKSNGSITDKPDWPKQIPDLHTIIATESRLGIWVNGVKLEKGEVGRMQYGRIHTGDEVVVHPGRDETEDKARVERIAFRVELYHGEGRLPRPDGMSFKVEIEGSSGSVGKGKEKAAV